MPDRLSRQPASSAQARRSRAPAGLGRTLCAAALLLSAMPLSATDLRDGSVGAGAAIDLENGGATLRIEAARIDATPRRVFTVPEPGAVVQLAAGVAGLALLSRRRRGP